MRIKKVISIVMAIVMFGTFNVTVNASDGDDVVENNKTDIANDIVAYVRPQLPVDVWNSGGMDDQDDNYDDYSNVVPYDEDCYILSYDKINDEEEFNKKYSIGKIVRDYVVKEAADFVENVADSLKGE